MGSCLHVASDVTCTMTESLHVVQPDNGGSKKKSSVYVAYLATGVLFIFDFEKNLCASWCCLEYSSFLWYEK